MKMGFVLKAHDDLNDGHKMISISAYRESTFSDEVIYREIYKSEPVTIGCKIWDYPLSLLYIFIGQLHWR